MSNSYRLDKLSEAIYRPSFEAAEEAMASFDEDAQWAIEPLLEMYTGGGARTKYLSARALIRLKEPRVIDLLLQDLEARDEYGRRDGAVNAAAALALGSAERSPEIIQALRRLMMEEESAYARFASLGFFIPKLGLPQSGSCLVQEVAGLSLVELGDRESGRQIVRLAIGQWHWHIPKEKFIKYMHESGWESTISDVASLFGTDAMTAVSCLAAIGDEQCVEPLIEALKDERPEVRKKAIEALADIGGGRALEAITQATHDEKWGVRRTAKRMLRKLSRGR